MIHTLHNSKVVYAHMTLPDNLVAQAPCSCLCGVFGFILGVGKPDKIFVVGVHVCQFVIDHENKLFFTFLFTLSNMSGDDTLSFFTQSWILAHLLSTHSHDIGEFNNHQIYTFQDWLFETTDLSLGDCLKGHIRCE